MDIQTDAFELAGLSARADVSVRTIRYYIQQGLLPSPESRGPGTRYGPEHLDRLRLIKRLQREHLPLAEIRRRLEALGPEEIRRMADDGQERPRSSASDYIRGVLSEPGATFSAAEPMAGVLVAESAIEPAPLASPPREEQLKRSPTRSQWDRIVLAPDVELHVRRPLSREQNRQVERLLEAARNIFEENAP